MSPAESQSQKSKSKVGKLITPAKPSASTKKKISSSAKQAIDLKTELPALTKPASKVSKRKAVKGYIPRGTSSRPAKGDLGKSPKEESASGSAK